MLLSSIIIFFILFIYITKGPNISFALFFGFYIIGLSFSLISSFKTEHFLILFFLLSNLKKIIFSLKKNHYPFIIGSISSILSYTISSFYSIGDPHWGMTISKCLSYFFFPILFFYYINTDEDINRILKIIGVIILCTAVLALIDIITKRNNYAFSLEQLTGRPYGWDRSHEYRYGIQRIQTFFLQPVSYGYFCLTFLSFYLLFFYKKFSSITLRYDNISTLVLILTIGGFLSGSRTTIVPIVLLFLFFYRKKIWNPRIAFTIIPIFIIIFLNYKSYFNSIIDSIIYSNDEAMGSTTDTRLNQWTITLYYWNLSPIIGLGTNAVFDYVIGEMSENMHGAESVWFSLLINNGIVGCITYLILYIESFVYLKKYKWIIFVFLFLQLLLRTSTSTPGFHIGHMMCLILLIYKYNQHYNMANSSNLLWKQ